MKPIWWVVTAAAILGAVLNVLQSPWCFGIWAVTNAAWATTNVRRRQYPQAGLFLVYLGLAIWGLAAWLR